MTSDTLFTRQKPNCLFYSYGFCEAKKDWCNETTQEQSTCKTYLEQRVNQIEARDNLTHQEQARQWATGSLADVQGVKIEGQR